MLTLTCPECAKEFTRAPSQTVEGGSCCSRSCSAKHWERTSTLVDRECETCHATFKAKPSKIASGRARYCSRDCTPNPFASAPEEHPRWKGGKVERECEQCHESFAVHPSVISRSDKLQARYCSRECQFADRHPSYKHGRSRTPEYAVEQVQKRRAHKVANGGTFTQADIDALFEAQKGLCEYCSVDISDRKYHIDHMTPLSRGGSNWPDNLQLLCPSCNLRKNDLTDAEYRERVTALTLEALLAA